MNIPKYVQEIMARSEYEFDFFKDHENYAPGYTLRIRKATPYTKIETFHEELERLVRWADRVAGVGTGYVLSCPQKTHYTDQYAVVTIFDPVMKYLEKFIP